MLVLQNLYNANVRNVVVMGLAPLGCAPYYLWLYQSANGECVKSINNMILEFNYGMRFVVEQLNHELVGANIIFCDAFEGSMDIMKNSDRYGGISILEISGCNNVSCLILGFGFRLQVSM